MYCVAASIVIVSGVERLVRQCNQLNLTLILIIVYKNWSSRLSLLVSLPYQYLASVKHFNIKLLISKLMHLLIAMTYQSFDPSNHDMFMQNNVSQYVILRIALAYQWFDSAHHDNPGHTATQSVP